MHRQYKKIRLLSLLLAVALVVSGCALVDSAKYKKAVEYFEQSNYAEAKTIFAEINEYEDSGKYLQYIDAAEKAANNDYSCASAAFSALADFRNSSELAVYYAARQAETEERYEDAGELYQQAPAYGDAARRLSALPDLIKARDARRRAADYEEVQKLLNEGSYEEALVLLNGLDTYEDFNKLLMYAHAMQMAENGGYELAVHSFVSLEEYRDSKLQSIYYRARWAEAEQRHEDAAELYKTIATFRDSTSRLMAQQDLILDRDFAAFKALIMGEEYPDAYKISYEKYHDFETEKERLLLLSSKYTYSETHMLEQFYALGEEALDKGLYPSASALFGLLNDCSYRDSAVRMQDVRYASATKDMTSGAYDAALRQLDALAAEGYTAALESQNECYYQMGLEAERNLDYDAAHNCFALAGTYKDSADKAARFAAEYAAAEALLAEEKYAEALEAFAALHNYSDAADRTREPNYELALQALAAGEYERALSYFEAAKDYQDATCFIEAEKLFAEGRYSTAITRYNAIKDIPGVALRMNMIQYAQAEACEAAGQLGNAAIYFKKLDGYSDARERAGKCYYELAKQYAEKGDFETAANIFAKAGDYKDAALRSKQFYYQYAKESLAQGKIAAAKTAFEKAGNYMDAVKQLVEINQSIAEYGNPIDFSTENELANQQQATVHGLYAKYDTETGKYQFVIDLTVPKGYSVYVFDPPNGSRVSFNRGRTTGERQKITFELPEKTLKEITHITINCYKSDRDRFFIFVNQSAFKNIKQLSIGSKYDTVISESDRGGIIALKADGTVLSAHWQDLVEHWRDIVLISLGKECILGLKADGTVVAVGNNSYFGNHVSDWRNIVSVSAGNAHAVGLRSDGTVVTQGVNADGRCNVNGWKDIVAVSAGEKHTVGLKKDGTVVATGANQKGQCEVDKWENIVSISAGGEHTVGLKADGRVVATGLNAQGQCGVRGWRNIIAVSAGEHCTIGLKADGTVVLAGGNQYAQKMISQWKDIVAVGAGHGCAIGVKADGTVVLAPFNEAQQEYYQKQVENWNLN